MRHSAAAPELANLDLFRGESTDFYAAAGLDGGRPDFGGETILTGEQVEYLNSYPNTLKQK